MKQIIANAPRNTLAMKERHNKYAVPNYELDINNPADSHSILAKNALGAKHILDVGCGVGYIGKKLKEVQDCVVDGIEADGAAAKIAAKSYDNVLIMTLGDKNDVAFQSFVKSKGRFDCIICGDILEHLADPGFVLSILAKKLKPSGKIVVSIPNIAHVDVIAGLVDGRFNYATCGILDSTHLRFWTENSFYEFIKNVNDESGLRLCPKLIGRTYVESETYDSTEIKRICGDSCIAFQNIFILTVGDGSLPKIKRANYFQQAVEEIATTREALSVLEKRVRDLEQSTSWKITAPLRKIGVLLKH